MERVRVAIVDDHEAVRLGFAGTCDQFGFDLLGSAATVTELLEQIADKDCEVVICDLSLADGSLVKDNVERLVAVGPAVLIFSIADRASLMRAALRAGAVAIVPKSQPMADLAEAIRLSAKGVIINNSETTAMIDADTLFLRDANLSNREREVLSLYASGMSLKQVAFELKIKRSSAKEHIDRVRVKYAKLGREAGTKVDLFKRAVEDGILTGELL
ncbi:response regulator transcription factor [Candidatus Aquiluna sp. UB-MaderosW2red]|uniref:response regulator transcription factor n=1 Tax=Candidatus Aquiluna sp. UB-MaderosW2red TaxID=1855377 RepID=UPI000875DF17|nr:response regulator transcription factor [Candidatus Aquiluna sp. UB-MaderosW2red]SCX07715.1 DNA-binding response regulator, NarL/FixJ family, contains REC and HTH domains [Candidatus Aquiluna sp. UB-MaderosW2red]